jgi:hypothetical protein
MIDGLPIAQLTASTLLGIAVLLILFGRLVPRSTLTKAEKNAEQWRLAYEAMKERSDTSDAQTAELLELAKASYSIMVAMFGTATSNSRLSGEARVVPTPTKR